MPSGCYIGTIQIMYYFFFWSNNVLLILYLRCQTQRLVYNFLRIRKSPTFYFLIYKIYKNRKNCNYRTHISPQSWSKSSRIFFVSDPSPSITFKSYFHFHKTVLFYNVATVQYIQSYHDSLFNKNLNKEFEIIGFTLF